MTMHHDNFLQQNQLDALISQIYFWNKTLHVSDSSSVHHQQFSTVHTAMVYVIQVCWQLASRIRMFHPDPARKLYDIYHCCVYSEKLMVVDRGTVQNMQFYSKNKFEKLVHLVGFITRIKILNLCLCNQKQYHGNVNRSAT